MEAQSSAHPAYHWQKNMFPQKVELIAQAGVTNWRPLPFCLYGCAAQATALLWLDLKNHLELCQIWETLAFFWTLQIIHVTVTFKLKNILQNVDNYFWTLESLVSVYKDQFTYYHPQNILFGSFFETTWLRLFVGCTQACRVWLLIKMGALIS